MDDSLYTQLYVAVLRLLSVYFVHEVRHFEVTWKNSVCQPDQIQQDIPLEC